MFTPTGTESHFQRLFYRAVSSSRSKIVTDHRTTRGFAFLSAALEIGKQHDRIQWRFVIRCCTTSFEERHREMKPRLHTLARIDWSAACLTLWRCTDRLTHLRCHRNSSLVLELQYLQLKVEFALKSVAVARLLTARRAKTFPKAPVDSKISKRQHEAGDGLQKKCTKSSSCNTLEGHDVECQTFREMMTLKNAHHDYGFFQVHNCSGSLVSLRTTSKIIGKVWTCAYLCSYSIESVVYYVYIYIYLYLYVYICIYMYISVFICILCVCMFSAHSNI